MSYKFERLVINNNCASFFDEESNSQISIPHGNVISRINGDSFYEVPMVELLKAKAAFDALNAPPIPESVYTPEIDPGAHYRYEYRGIKLDPFRICQIYGVNDFSLQTIIKKALKAGERGHKDMRQDLRDIVNAANRKLEMMDEDNG